MDEILPLGKLDIDFLSRLLELYGMADDRVVVGARVGEDATVIDFGDRYLVAKTDPITFTTEEIGWYAVNVNANDVATTGAIPRWFLVTLLLPEGKTDEALVERIFAQLHSACVALGISLCGGHTEITYDLGRPLLIGFMLGEVERDRLVSTAGAQPGDSLLLTKGIAIEGTAIIAHEKAGELAEKFPSDFLARCQDLLHKPGISVVREARLAAEVARVHAMHDPTEGGLANGLWEMALAAEVGMLIDEKAIPILPETARLCAEYGLDPLGLISSGALLMALAPQDAPKVLARLEEEGIKAARIGQVVCKEEGVRFRGSGEKLPRFARDELARLFDKE